jgi:hypothetical protein
LQGDLLISHPEGSREILERYGEIGSRYSKIRGDLWMLQRNLGKIYRNPGAIEGDSLQLHIWRFMRKPAKCSEIRGKYREIYIYPRGV